MNRILIFYHIYLIGPYTISIVSQQLSLILHSGLLDSCESLNIGVINPNKNLEYNPELQELIDSFNIDNKIKILFNISGGDERDTAIQFKDFSDKLSEDEEAFILYFHTKGVTHFNQQSMYPTKYWRHHMEYFNILRWKDCVCLLRNGYDSCGVLWIDKKTNHEFLRDCEWEDAGFYGGTFFWMTTNLIKKIDVSCFSKYGRYSIEVLPSHVEHSFYSFDDYPIKNFIDFYNTSYYPKNYQGKNFQNKKQNNCI